MSSPAPTPAAAAAPSSSSSSTVSAPSAADLSPLRVSLSIESPSGKSVRCELSSSDHVFDIRQFLFDHPYTCEFTCYHLEWMDYPDAPPPSAGQTAQGILLNEYSPITDYPQLSDGFTHHLRIVPEFYDEKMSKLHVRRVRELLAKPPAIIVPSFVPSIEETNPQMANLFQQGNSKKNNKKFQRELKSAESLPSDNSPSSLTSVATKTLMENFGLSKQWEDTQTGRPKIPPTVECLRNLSFAAWNPPPGNRRLRGDLCYLTVRTLEENTFHVTSCVDGFFLNKSTDSKFDPSPAELPYKSHSLIDLLKKASPLFNAKFSQLTNRKVPQHPFESMEILTHRPADWISPIPQHSADWNKAEDFFLNTFGVDSRGLTRDWNEEIQSCRDLPKSTQQERIFRDKASHKVYSEFVDAAVKGATAIILGHIPAVNPTDPPKQQVFIYNAIFFSFAVDARDHFIKHGGDRVGQTFAYYDLRGVEAIAKLDLNNISTVGTVVVDYRGHRIVCQSIIPGIFSSGDKGFKHLYGSMDNGQSIVSKPEFKEAAAVLSEKFHLAEHSVTDASGQCVSLTLSMETKGILGSDGRLYVLEVNRLTPRDLNFPNDSTHLTALLRPELIFSFCRKTARETVAKSKEKSKEIPPAAADQKDQKDEKEKEKEREREREEQGKIIEAFNAIRFNPDLGTLAKSADSADVIESQKSLLQKAADYLLNEVIPSWMDSMKSLDVCPEDTAALIRSLHQRGINTRYLGKIAALSEEKSKTVERPSESDEKATPSPSSSSSPTPSVWLHLLRMCRIAMIVRVCQTLLVDLLREVHPDRSERAENWYLAPTISKFLSALLGPHCGGHRIGQKEMQNAAGMVRAHKQLQQKYLAEYVKQIEHFNGEAPSTETEESPEDSVDKDALIAQLTGTDAPRRGGKSKRGKSSKMPDFLAPPHLWQTVRDVVKERFDYEIPEVFLLSAREKLSILRSLCQASGVVVVCRDYELEPSSNNESPFTVDDILDLQPVVRTFYPQSQDCQALLAAGKTVMQRGQIALSMEYFLQALAHHTEIFGVMHADTADCFSNLANIAFHMGDYGRAIDYQQRALVIHERLLGHDHVDTAQSHMAMALFLMSVEQTQAALKHMRRALFLFELICGPEHPDTAAAHSNIAMIYQDNGLFQHAIKHLEKALQINLNCLGVSHVQTAQSYHAVAFAHACLHNFRQAVDLEKKSRDAFISVYGNKHQRVVQSNIWLDHFTQINAKGIEGQPTASNRMGLHQLIDGRIIPTALNSTSPLLWVSLHSALAFRGRFGMNDILSLFQSTGGAKGQKEKDTQNAQNAATLEALQQQIAAMTAAQSTTAAPSASVEAEDDEGEANGNATGGKKNKKKKNKGKAQ